MPAFSLNRCLAWFHRWAGIVLGLLFVAWFVSGAVLVYVPFPALARRDQLAHSEPLDASRLTQSPAAALRLVPNATGLDLISVAGRPVYLAFSADGRLTAIAGDAGARALFATAAIRQVAERFGGSRVARLDGPLQYDQWIVHQRFDPFRPFYRARLEDPGHTDLYVSARTGQVLQRTTAHERAWNWAGAVLHWIYFTPLRKSWSAWNAVVWWLSLVALLSSSAGIWLGVDRLMRVRAVRRARWSPFRGWLRWHHVSGLFASAVVLIWMFSGWLSMDHGRMFPTGKPDPMLAVRLQGAALESIVQAVPRDFMRHVGPAAEIHFGAVAGQPFIAAQGGRGGPSIDWLDPVSGAQSTPRTQSTSSIPDDLLLKGLHAAWGAAARIQPAPERGTDFYAVAESLTDSATAFQIAQAQALRVYVDRITGKLLVVMDPGRRAYAWVYYAVHTFNFPVLLDHPNTRAALILVLLAIGFAFTCTGIVVGCQRLGRMVGQ